MLRRKTQDGPWICLPHGISEISCIKIEKGKGGREEAEEGETPFIDICLPVLTHVNAHTYEHTHKYMQFTYCILNFSSYYPISPLILEQNFCGI